MAVLRSRLQAADSYKGPPSYVFRYPDKHLYVGERLLSELRLLNHLYLWLCILNFSTQLQSRHACSNHRFMIYALTPPPLPHKLSSLLMVNMHVA